MLVRRERVLRERVSRPHHTPGSKTDTHMSTTESDLMAPEINVQRIMTTGTAWFAVAVGSVAVTLGLLLSSGWRPTTLPEGLQALWWLSALTVGLSVGLIGWSGCPILEVSVPVADRNKTRTMQLGTLLFIVGGAGSLLAVMLS